jgi:hypothetical protein
MSNDFLRSWQQWAAALDPTARPGQPWWLPVPAATPPGAAPGATGSYGEMLERFAAAARQFQSSGAPGNGPAAGEAGAGARAFADWLRDQFREPGTLWANPAQVGLASWHSLPAMGPLREQQLQAERIARAGQRMEEARARCLRLWSDMLRQAAEGFARELAAGVSAGASAAGASTSANAAAADARQLYDQWINAAEEAYGRMARSDEFVQAQADFINAGGEMRRELSGYAADCAKFLDLPTRTELDTVHERLRELQAAVEKLATRPARRGKT